MVQMQPVLAALIGQVVQSAVGTPSSTARLPAYPLWWRIPTLSQDDILGAWDFGWNGHKAEVAAMDPFVGVLPPFSVVDGQPAYHHGDGFYFNGNSVMSTLLPEIDVEGLSVIVQFHTATQNGPLDAFYSHYLGASHYSLQNRFSDGFVRWSCGDGDSPTVEVSGLITEGIYSTSGPHLYINGVHRLDVPDAGTATANGLNFNLGAVFTGAYTQHLKATVKRILIVDRLLTDYEQWEIAYQMEQGQSPPWWLAPGIEDADAAAIYNFADALDRDEALAGLVGPKLYVKTGAPGHAPGQGIGFGGGAILEMETGIMITPGESTLMVKLLNPAYPFDWQCFAGFDKTADSVAIQQKASDGVCHYNGAGYDGTHNNYACNQPVASSEWLVNAGGVLYRNGAPAANAITPVSRPEGEHIFQVGAIGGDQRYAGTISQVLIYDKILTPEQIAAVTNNATRGPIMYEGDPVTHGGVEVTYHG